MTADLSPITLGPTLTAHLDTRGAPTVVRLHGELDLAAAEAFERLVSDLTATGAPVELDLTDVAFIDPRGARLLVTMTPCDGGVVVAAVSPMVRRVLQIAYPHHPLGRDATGPSGPDGPVVPGRTLGSRRRDDPRAVVHPTGRFPMTDPHAADGPEAHSHPHEHDGSTHAHAHEHASHDHDHVEHAHVHGHAGATGTAEHEHAHAHDPAVAETHEHAH